jgi:hypothetical protein
MDAPPQHTCHTGAYSKLLATRATRPTSTDAVEAVTGLPEDPVPVESPLEEEFEGNVRAGNEKVEGAASQPSASDSHTPQICAYSVRLQPY